MAGLYFLHQQPPPEPTPRERFRAMAASGFFEAADIVEFTRQFPRLAEELCENRVLVVSGRLKHASVQGVNRENLTFLFDIPGAGRVQAVSDVNGVRRLGKSRESSGVKFEKRDVEISANGNPLVRQMENVTVRGVCTSAHSGGINLRMTEIVGPRAYNFENPAQPKKASPKVEN